MADYEVLAPGGHENLINNITERLDEKAYIDGYYAQLTAGAADNLTARGDAVDAEFMRRTSGGINDIESGNATIESIKGKTLVWNQAVPAFDDTWTTNAVTTSYDQTTGTVTVTCASDNNVIKRTSKTSAAGIAGHKYYMASTVDASHISVSASASIGFNSGSSNSGLLGFAKDTVGRVSGIVEATADSTAVVLRIPSNTASGDYVTYRDTIIIDLTLIFGEGNEPSTVAEFERMFPESYYAYDAGSLLSVNMEGIETTGFNAYNSSTGTAELLGGNEYQITGTYTSISYSTGETLTPDSDGYFTPTLNGTLAVTGGGSNTCVHLTWSGRRDGEYEEYWKTNRPIPVSTYFPNGMRSVTGAADELTATQAVTRIAEFDLGNRTWNAYSSGQGYTYYANFTGGAPTKANGANNIICASYALGTSGATLADRQISGASNNNRVYIRDDRYATEADLKAALSGVMLYYELNEPTTTPIDPPLNLTYKVDDWGTEEVMVPTGMVSATPEFSIVYGMNAVDTIRRLPDLYAGKDATEQALDGKADIDGYYQQLTVGSAENLIGRGNGVTASYLYRSSGGDIEVADGIANIRNIKGRTLGWNQIAPSGSVTNLMALTAGDRVTSGHKYLYGCTFTITEAGTTAPSLGLYTKTDSNVPIKSVYCPSAEVGTWHVAEIFTSAYSATATGEVNKEGALWFYINKRSATVEASAIQLFDLTQMFGAGNEPSTVAEFEALYPEPYYPYDAGSLLSVQMEGIETNGRNLWGGEAVRDNIESAISAATDGENTHGRYVTYIAANASGKQFFGGPFKENTQYTLILSLGKSNTTSSTNIGIRYTDGSYANITRTSTADDGTPELLVNYSNADKTIKSISGFNSSGTTYLYYDQCGLFEGYLTEDDFEPNWKNERSIPAATYFPDGMRSAGTVYDELTSDAAVTRVGEVTVNSASSVSSLNVLTSGVRFYVTVSDMDPCISVLSSENTGVSNLGSYYASPNITESTPMPHFYAYDNRVYYVLDDTSIDTADKALAWVNSHSLTLTYQLATPTTTPIDPPLNMSYRVENYGTERVMVPAGEQSAPPIMQAVYGINAVDTIIGLPKDYISHDSFTQFRLALGAKLGIFIVETWDETDGRYEYTINDA